MTQHKIDTLTNVLSAFGFSITTKVGLETFLPMENEIISTAIHVVGTVIGGVSIWLITDFIKRKLLRK